MTTIKENKDFIEEIIGPSLLEDSIDWISQNMAIEEIFDRDIIIDWIKDNLNNIEKVDVVLEAGLRPEDVFDEDLVKWAETNGYYKENIQ